MTKQMTNKNGYTLREAIDAAVAANPDREFYVTVAQNGSRPGTFAITVMADGTTLQWFPDFPTRTAAWDAVEAANDSIKHPADSATRREVDCTALPPPPWVEEEQKAAKEGKAAEKADVPRASAEVYRRLAERLPSLPTPSEKS